MREKVYSMGSYITEIDCFTQLVHTPQPDDN